MTILIELAQKVRKLSLSKNKAKFSLGEVCTMAAWDFQSPPPPKREIPLKSRWGPKTPHSNGPRILIGENFD